MEEEGFRLYPLEVGDRVIAPDKLIKRLWSRGREGTIEGISGYDESVIDVWSEITPKAMVRFDDGSSGLFSMKELVRIE